MAARSAFLGSLDKDCFTEMTSAPDTLDHFLANEILTSRARGNSKRNIRVAGILEVRRERESAALARADFANLGLRSEFALGFGLLTGGWEAGTFGAARVLAVHADLLRTKGGFAAVAGSADSHANGLGDPSQFDVGSGSLPFAGVESQAVFGEEGARLLLLHDTIVGEHGGLLGGSCWLSDRGSRWSTIDVDS
jgi:hypothetical protein